MLYFFLGVAVRNARTASARLWSQVLSFYFGLPFSPECQGAQEESGTPRLTQRGGKRSVRLSGQNPVETLASQVHANEDSEINIPAIPTTPPHTHKSFSPHELQNERK